jgi:hypothetical protein
MAQNFSLLARTLQTGDTAFGPFNIPASTALIVMTFDVAAMVAGLYLPLPSRCRRR